MRFQVAVGRLDKGTSGVVLVTDDGDLNNLLCAGGCDKVAEGRLPENVQEKFHPLLALSSSTVSVFRVPRSAGLRGHGDCPG